MIKTKDILYVDVGGGNKAKGSFSEIKEIAKLAVSVKISNTDNPLETEALTIYNKYKNVYSYRSRNSFKRGFSKYASKVYPDGFTENGEDGVLLQIFNEIGVTNKNSLEIGAGDGVNHSVTADLRFNHGWMGYLIDGFVPVNKLINVDSSQRDAYPEAFIHNNGWPLNPDRKNNEQAIIISKEKTDRTSADASELDIDKAVLKNNDPDYSKHSYFIKKMVTSENINKTLSDHNVPDSLDLLSIDIDSIDWYIWKEIGPRARVVMVEYNPNILPSIDAVIKYDPDFRITTKDGYRGSSIRALYNLGKSMGYSLIHSINCNLIFVRDEEVAKIKTKIPWKDDVNALYAMSAYYVNSYFSIGRHISVFRSEKYKNDERLWVSSSELI